MVLIAPCMLASVLASGVLGFIDQRSKVVGDGWIFTLDSNGGDVLVVRTCTIQVSGGALLFDYDGWFTDDPQNIRQHMPSPLLSHYTDWNPRYPDFVDLNSDPPFKTIHAGGVRFMALRGGGGIAEGRVTHLVLVIPLRLLG